MAKKKQQKEAKQYGLKWVTHLLRSGRWGRGRLSYADGEWKEKRTLESRGPRVCSSEGFHFHATGHQSRRRVHGETYEASHWGSSVLLLVEVAGKRTDIRNKSCCTRMRPVRVLGQGSGEILLWQLMVHVVATWEGKAGGSAVAGFVSSPSREALRAIRSSKHPADVLYRKLRGSGKWPPVDASWTRVPREAQAVLNASYGYDVKQPRPARLGKPAKP